MDNRHFSVFRVTNCHISSTPLYGHWLSGHCLFSLSQADSTLPTCNELNANWEEEFFSSLSASTSQNSQDDDSDKDIVEVNAESKEPKVKSLEDVTEYFTSEILTETANDLSKVLSNIQSTWLSRKLKAPVQSIKSQTFSNDSIVVFQFWSETYR